MPRSAIAFACAIASFLLLTFISIARADVFGEDDRVMVEVGPYVYHWIDNSDHNQWPRLIGVEYETASHWLGGVAAYKNSYYQNSAFAYAGKRWFIEPVDENLYVKVSAGLMYGYKEPYEDRVPLNHNGYGLAIVPAVGYQFGRANAQLVFLGTAAVALTIGYDFWD